jgi:hypothetical protein
MWTGLARVDLVTTARVASLIPIDPRSDVLVLSGMAANSPLGSES